MRNRFAVVFIAVLLTVHLAEAQQTSDLEEVPLRNWPVSFEPLLHHAARETGRRQPVANAVPTEPSHFIAVVPCRLVDTRNPNGPFGGPIFAPGETRSYNLPAASQAAFCGVPAAAAYSLNFTLANYSGRGNLKAYPSGSAPPNVSILNYGSGLPLGNAATVAADATGSIDVAVAATATPGPTHVIIDINGYFAEGVVTKLTAGTGMMGGGTGNVTLGIAPAGVGTTQLNASGSAAGQILTSTGSGVEWQTPASGAATGTSSNTPNTFVVRDGTGSFSAGSLTLSGKLALPTTTSATTGVISLGNSPFLHNYGSNTFVGASAGNFTMAGNSNTAVGESAFTQNVGGIANTTAGYYSLHNNASGSDNTAVGHAALSQNTSGSRNIAIGQGAGGNVLGNDNIVIGNIGSGADSGTIRIGTDGTHTRTFLSGVYGVAGNPGAATVVIDGLGQLGTNAGITPTLSGEVTGPLTNTVVSNAVSTNTLNAIVRRDGSGDFAANKATLSTLAVDSATSATVGLIRMGNARSFITTAARTPSSARMSRTSR